VRMADDLPPL